MSSEDIMGIFVIVWAVSGIALAVFGELKKWHYDKAKLAAYVHFASLFLVALFVLPWPWFFHAIMASFAFMSYFLFWKYYMDRKFKQSQNEQKPRL